MSGEPVTLPVSFPMAIPKASQALARFTVLDLTRVRAGPTCVRQLADWGANVIKIEMPPDDKGGDAPGGPRDGFDFQNLHRNKRSMTLNLKTPEGHAAFMKLVKNADVIVENLRPDVKHRLGIDYEAVKKVNPRIVYGSISGFGQDGPYGRPAGRRPDRPGHGRADVDHRAARAGPGARRHPDRRPHRGQSARARHHDGAVRARDVGRWVSTSTSLLEAQIFMLDFQAARWLIAKEVAKQAGNDHPTGIPTGVFPDQRRPHQHRRHPAGDLGALLPRCGKPRR